MNYKADYLGFKNISGPTKSVRKKVKYSEFKKNIAFFKSMLKPIQEDIVKIFRLLRDSVRKGIDFEMEASKTSLLKLK